MPETVQLERSRPARAWRPAVIDAVSCAHRCPRRGRPPEPPLPIKRPHLHANFGEDW